MSETSLSPVQQRFILHWGEMGARWGINRTVAQVHALLYLSPSPRHAEHIASALSVARSNVSTSLRELEGWGIVRVVHVLGDRRDHFESLKDVWQMFDIIIAERKRREVDPTIEMLHACLSDTYGKPDPYTAERVTAMRDFFDTMTGFYNDLERLPKGVLPALTKLRGKVKKLLVMRGGSTMTARQFWILIGTAGILHNGLRLVANVLGAKWDFFNYLHPFLPIFNPVGVGFAIAILVVLAFGVYMAAWEWRTSASQEDSAYFVSGLWAIPTSLAAGLLAVLVATKAQPTYGWLLFVVVPVIVGFQSALLLGRRKPTTLGQAILIAIASVASMGVLLVLVAVEGLICVAMAAPLAIPLAALGGALGYLATRETSVKGATTFLLLAGLAPFGATLEHALAPQAAIFEIQTSINLAAPPERVWRAIIEPGNPSAPSNWLFRAGVGYPLSNHLDGIGPSATRYCDFSTGKLVEPVIVWDQNRELRFRV